MTKQVDFIDPLTGQTKTSWIEPDGTIIFNTEQQNQPVIDANKTRRDLLGEKHNFGKKTSNWQHVAEIPRAVYDLWMSTLGDWRTDEFARRKWIERLNSNEYRSFRIDTRRL